ncbi:MAG: PaaD-like protein (DUF59) involved in Fe-S cluster assembly, partial [uncultured Rubrobacteraceae bacterium]
AYRGAREGPVEKRHRPGDRDGSRRARPDLRRGRTRGGEAHRCLVQLDEPDVSGWRHDPGAGRDRGSLHRGRGDRERTAHLRAHVEPGDDEPRRQALLRPL